MDVPSEFRFTEAEFNSLQKGSRISKQQLEYIVNMYEAVDHVEYNFRKLKFKEWLEKELEKNGCVWTLAEVANRLCILTDREASTYNKRKHKNSTKRMLKAHYKNQHVDTSNLSNYEREGHVRTLAKHGQIIQAMDDAGSQTVKMSPYKRKLPVTGFEVKEPEVKLEPIPYVSKRSY
jgi:hypothetical protein